MYENKGTTDIMSCMKIRFPQGFGRCQRPKSRFSCKPEMRPGCWLKPSATKLTRRIRSSASCASSTPAPGVRAASGGSPAPQRSKRQWQVNLPTPVSQRGLRKAALQKEGTPDLRGGKGVDLCCDNMSILKASSQTWEHIENKGSRKPILPLPNLGKY